MKITKQQKIASLWSGYGSITRLTLSDGSSLIRKQVAAPTTGDADESHKRKMISYQVERYFYQNVASLVEDAHLAALQESGDNFLCMEDLSVRYPYQDVGRTSIEDEKLVLKWLANFHASLWMHDFPTVPPPLEASPADAGLWQEGSFWYFRTRQDEHESLKKTDKWRQIGVRVDAMLREIPKKYLTIIHGDAKSANVAFSKNKSSGRYDDVAMYDFQYVGYSPGVRDVVYYLVSSSNHFKTSEKELLQYYYETLMAALQKRVENSTGEECIQSKLQDLLLSYSYEVMLSHYELCLMDYYRFMKGWGMWGNSQQAGVRCEEILARTAI